MVAHLGAIWAWAQVLACPFSTSGLRTQPLLASSSKGAYSTHLTGLYCELKSKD